MRRGDMTLCVLDPITGGIAAIANRSGISAYGASLRGGRPMTTAKLTGPRSMHPNAFCAFCQHSSSL